MKFSFSKQYRQPLSCGTVLFVLLALLMQRSPLNGLFSPSSLLSGYSTVDNTSICGEIGGFGGISYSTQTAARQAASHLCISHLNYAAAEAHVEDMADLNDGFSSDGDDGDMEYDQYNDMQDHYGKTLGFSLDEYKNRVSVLFDKIPKSSEKIVSRDELFRYAEKVAKVSQLVHSAREFNALDKDGDGYVSFEEMNQLYATTDEGEDNESAKIEKQFAKERFATIDIDGDGKLTLSEMRILLNPGMNEALLEIETKAVMSIQSKDDDFIDFDEYTDRAVTNPSDDELAAMRADFDSYDKDGDGKISRDEIKSVIKNIHVIELEKGVDEIMKYDGETVRSSITMEEFLDPETGIGISVITGGGDILRNPETYPDLELPLTNAKTEKSFEESEALKNSNVEDLLGENGQEKLAQLLKQFENEKQGMNAGPEAIHTDTKEEL